MLAKLGFARMHMLLLWMKVACVCCTIHTLVALFQMMSQKRIPTKKHKKRSTKKTLEPHDLAEDRYLYSNMGILMSADT